jgi:hypothetical protein
MMTESSWSTEELNELSLLGSRQSGAAHRFRENFRIVRFTPSMRSCNYYVSEGRRQTSTMDGVLLASDDPGGVNFLVVKDGNGRPAG